MTTPYKLDDNTTVHFEGLNIIIKQEVEQEIESVELTLETFNALMVHMVTFAILKECPICGQYG